MRVHDQQIGRVLENGRVAIQQRLRPRDGGIDAVGHFLNVEQRGQPVHGLRARVVRPEYRLFH